MKLVIQKVSQASVAIGNKIVGKINKGLMVLVGVTHGDSEKDIDYLVNKLVNLRLFPSENSYFDQSLAEAQGEILVVSQFTLYASTKKGRRPDFTASAKPDFAEPLYKKFVQKLVEAGLPVKTGVFGANMQINLVNDGPVTLILDSPVV